MKKISNRLMLLTKEEKVYYALFAIISAFCFFTMEYTDGRVNASVGYQLCRSFFEGSFAEYWKEAFFSYGISIYVIYALWSVPIVLFDMLFGKNTSLRYAPSGYIFWYKLLLVVFALICLYLICKIVKSFYVGYASKDVVLLTASSSLFFFPVLMITQCDVIELSFILLGIWLLLQERKALFVLVFSFAATMKYLALFIFIPLILFCFKKRHYLTAFIGGGLLVLSSSAILAITSKMPGLSGGESYVKEHISRIWDSPGVVSYFVLICLIAFIFSSGVIDSINLRKWIMWLSVASLFTLFVWYGANIYWYIILVPFLLFVSMDNANKFGTNVVLVTLYLNVSIIQKIIEQPWVFGGKYVWGLISKGGAFSLETKANPIPTTINYVLMRFGYSLADFLPAVKAVCFSIAMVFLVFNFPIWKTENGGAYKDIDSNFFKKARWTNLVILYIWVGFVAIFSYISKNII